MNIAAKITPTIATIDQLKPGSEYPGGSINSRKDYAAADIKDRLASIMSFGLLRPLLVLPEPDKVGPPFYIADGGLSREAIALGIKEKKLPAGYEVRISVHTSGDSAMALAASLEANEQVLTPHPVKIFETFSELATRGKTVEEIGTLFRLKPQEVRGYLALGALSPKIRKAWTDEQIEEEHAKAFTIASDHKQQDAAFDKLKRQGQWALKRTDQIRAALVGDQEHTPALLAFVGKEDYETAGGKVIEELFEGAHAVSDPAMLNKMVAAKITAKCDELVQDGWKWAEGGTDQNRYAEHSWQKVDGGKGASAKDKALAGCRVGIDTAGHLQILYGLIRPGDVKKTAKAAGTAKAKGKEKPKGPAKLSNSLDQRLESTLMRATQDALKGVAQGGKTLEHVLAAVIAAQLQPDRGAGYTPSEIRNALKTIRDRLPAKLLNEALAKRFDHKDYFSSSPKPFVVKAIEEMAYPAEAKKLAAGRKSDAWKKALTLFPKTGWLPKELRTIHYPGHGAGKKKAKA